MSFLLFFSSYEIEFLMFYVWVYYNQYSTLENSLIFLILQHAKTK